VKTRFLVLLLPAALLCACSGRRAGPVASGVAVVFQKQIFKLGRTPDPGLEADLEGLLSASHATAARNHSGDNPMRTGFTYSLSPRGAVYPFSEIEVSCIIQEKYARSTGPELCGDFFRELDVKIKRAVAGRTE
jgi:hypothetical protein